MATATKVRKTVKKAKLTKNEILKFKKTEKKIISKLINGSMKSSLSPEKTKMVIENMPLAIFMAKKYVRNNIDVQDLVQVASIGLIKAVKKYNPMRKGKLSYYAGPTIDGELKHFIRDNWFNIRVSRKCLELNARIQKYSEDFVYQNGREATKAEIAKKFKLKRQTLDKVAQALNAHNMLSFDAPVTAPQRSGTVLLQDVVGGDCFSDSMIEREGLAEALQTLEPRDQQIVKYHFFRQISQDAIASRFQITQAQVSRIIKHSCRKLTMVMM